MVSDTTATLGAKEPGGYPVLNLDMSPLFLGQRDDSPRSNMLELPITPVCLRVLVVMAVAQALVLAIVTTRCISRVVLKMPFGIEDIFVAIAVASSTVLFALYTFCMLMRSGLGHAEADFGDLNYEFNGKLNFVETILYGFGVSSARLGVFCFYLRAFAQKAMQRATKIVMVLTTVSIIAVTLWSAMNCQPVARNWNPKLDGYCLDSRPSWNTAAALGITSDIAALILPLPVIWGLKMRRKNKVNLTCLFAVGLSTVGIASWRLAALQSTVESDRAVIILTAALEINLVIACASLPVIYPLLSKSRQETATAPRAATSERSWQWITNTLGSATRWKNQRHFDAIDDGASCEGASHVRLASLHAQRSAEEGNNGNGFDSSRCRSPEQHMYWKK
ncbi:hypothetical protein F4780DRAFT_679249 [Xylariomycetidae sp. FL0641]|nr:hypothetical protein F4780DRAFT_679249 [Xylariomycetidae sp. FL0641]